MVSKELERPALKAIESLISIARFLAYTKRPSDELAKLLDQISYLPQLLLDENDQTLDFINALRDISQTVPESLFALREFESKMI